MSEWTEEMAQQMRARAQLALSTALTTTDCMCAMCIKARTELLLLDDHDRLTAERNALLRAIYPNGHDAESIEGPVRTVVELQEANARLHLLLKQALNGWGAYAKRPVELDDISRIYKEADL